MTAALATAQMPMANTMAPGDVSLTCSLLQMGGGKDFFSSKKALKLALGREKADAEITKLEGQFGEGKVYRFFAIADYVFPAAYRSASVHYGTSYYPDTIGRSLARDLINAGKDSSNNFSSERQLERIMGKEIHHELMNSIEERFGEGSTKDFHMVLDQLSRDMAPDAGIALNPAMPGG